MLSKLNKISHWQAAIIISLLGIAAYFDGLWNQFYGDDIPQIVNNLPVHSVSHIGLFFTGGTFYNGQGVTTLTGVYYRPLQTTVYSLIYNILGSQPIYFHLVQLFLFIGSTIILYVVLKYSFKPPFALFLSLIFLLHPLNSQAVFAIANMQDVLFFFFGILALWILFKYKSVRSLILVSLSLFLSLLSKESGILFVAMSLVYLFWYNRKRLYYFIGFISLPLALYVALRANAIGWLANPNNAPIDRLSLVGRLYTAPSIMLSYITKFIFPWKLSSAYYWVYPIFSINHFLLPLIADLAILSLVVFMAFVIHKRSTKARFVAYVYFMTWFMLGLCMVLQFVRLDFTASDPWFCFPMIGLLGMIGIVMTVFGQSFRFDRRVVYSLAVVIILILGTRTALRGRDWSASYTLAKADLSATSADFQADNQVAIYYAGQSDYYDSEVYAARSVAIFPYATNDNTLGVAYLQLGDYSDANAAFSQGLKYFAFCSIYDNMSVLTYYLGTPNSNQQFLFNAIKHCPADATPWLYLAILDHKYQNVSGAKYAITQAYELGSKTNSSIPIIYNALMNNQLINITP